jgi:hypothetical protein
MKIFSVKIKLFHGDRRTDGHAEASGSYSLRGSEKIVVIISSSFFRSSGI